MNDRIVVNDPIVEEVRRVRKELIQQHGGLDGYLKHLQAMDRRRLSQAKAKRAKKPVKRIRKAAGKT